jgi:hypothetical protein
MLSALLINRLAISGDKDRTVVIIAFKSHSFKEAIKKIGRSDIRLINGGKNYLVVKGRGIEIEKIAMGNIFYFPFYNLFLGCGG